MELIPYRFPRTPNKPQPRDRLPLSLTRFIRANYTRKNDALLTAPLITDIKLIPAHDCTLDKWGSYSCCWGMTHIIELTYSRSGYGATIGAKFDHNSEHWHFQVWMD